MSALMRRASIVAIAAVLALIGVLSPAAGQIASPTPVATTPPAVAEVPVTYTVGYAYPGLWLLPLLLLVVAPIVARALTKNLEPEGSP